MTPVMRPSGEIKKAGALGLMVLALALVGTSTVGGQGAGTASIIGTIKDPKGLVIPGAEVVVRNTDTGAERVLFTNEAGLYSTPLLQPGRYEVRVRKLGFSEMVRQDLSLEVGQTLALDIALPLKAVQETVEVSGAMGSVETVNFGVSQTIDAAKVENLPLNGRRWDNLVLLTPGVSEDGGSGGVSFRGISSLYSNNMVDGADNNQAFFSEARGRTRIPYGYSLNAIKEFDVTTAVYTAELGRAAGGTVNAITKSGTNEWHGDAFYFIRDDLWLARDPIAKGSGQPKPDERRQQFGGSFSGPVVRQRLFFFLNYDQQKRNFPAVITPSSANFFNSTSPGSQAQRCSDPNCPAVLAALRPLFNAINPRQGVQQLGIAKVDYAWDRNNRLSGVANILRWDSPNGIFTSPILSTTALAQGTDNVANEFLTIAWSRVMASTLVNEARFQYGRDFESQRANASGPSFRFDLIGGAAFGMRDFLPRVAFPNEKRFQWADNLSWVRNRHQFKTGLDLNHVRDSVRQLFQGGGVYSYLGPDALNRFARDLRLATTLAPSFSYSSFSQTVDPVTGRGRGSFRTNDYNFYFQDTLRVRSNLALNFALRYELQQMPAVVRPNPLVPETAKLNTDTNNFGHRFGFAWSPGRERKQVIRGGYGLYYGRTPNSTIFVHLFQNGVFQRIFIFAPSGGVAPCGAPVVPGIVFPQPDAAPALTPIFGTSGPTPTNEFPNLAAFLAACGDRAERSGLVTALDPRFVNPAVHQYDLVYERELPWKLIATVSYIGSRGSHLPVFVDANLASPSSTKTYLVLDGGGNIIPPSSVTVPFFVVTGPAGENLRPRRGLGVLVMGKSVINSWYNGLVVRFRRQESRGFSFDAHFTWSQARDNGGVAGANGTFAGTVSPLNPLDFRGEYGLSELDIRKRFVLNLYWIMPFSKWTKSASLKRVVGGWKMSSVWRFQDGRPVAAEVNGRPNCGVGGDGGLTCGAVDGTGVPVNGRVPFIARNSQFTSPGLITFDLRLAREFKLGDRSRFEFIWEAFNLFNRTNAVPSSGLFAVQNRAFDFVAPGGTVLPGLSPVICTNALAVVNFNGCLVQRRPPGTSASDEFLALRSTSNTLYTARQMQFGARIRF